MKKYLPKSFCSVVDCPFALARHTLTTVEIATSQIVVRNIALTFAHTHNIVSLGILHFFTRFVCFASRIHANIEYIIILSFLLSLSLLSAISISFHLLIDISFSITSQWKRNHMKRQQKRQTNSYLFGIYLLFIFQFNCSGTTARIKTHEIRKRKSTHIQFFRIHLQLFCHFSCLLVPFAVILIGCK